MEQWITYKGKLRYNPLRKNATKRASKPWVVVDIDYYLADFYRHMIIKNIINPFNQDPIPHRIHPSKWGTHVTVLDGRYDIPKQNIKFWGENDNKIIQFEYSPKIEQHWKFFVLPVRSKELDDIRTRLGLPVKKLHITVGRLE